MHAAAEINAHESPRSDKVARRCCWTNAGRSDSIKHGHGRMCLRQNMESIIVLGGLSDMS